MHFSSEMASVQKARPKMEQPLANPNGWVNQNSDLERRRIKRAFRECPWRCGMRASTWQFDSDISTESSSNWQTPSDIQFSSDNWEEELVAAIKVQREIEERPRREREERDLMKRREGYKLPRTSDGYLDIPFPTHHLLLNFIRVTSEDSAREFVKKFAEQEAWELTCYIWRWMKFGKGHQLANINLEQYELNHWCLFLEKVYPDPDLVDLPRGYRRKNIFEAATALRHAAVHREPFHSESLVDAMKLPSFLRDYPRKADLERVYNVFRHDSTATGEERAAVAALLESAQKPAVGWQVFDRILPLVEATCFRHFSKEFPFSFEREGWSTAEQVEMKKYYYDFCTSDNPRLAYLVFSGKQLRNSATHRHVLYSEEVSERLEDAMELAVMLGEPAQAFRIMMIGWEWSQKVARSQTLEILRGRRQPQGLLEYDCRDLIAN